MAEGQVCSRFASPLCRHVLDGPLQFDSHWARNFSRFRYRNTKDQFDPKYVNYLITERGIPKSVQDELKARLLPSECTADINRIFIHTEGSVRARSPASSRACPDLTLGT